MKRPTLVFSVYAEQDEALRGELEKHLALLQRQGVAEPGGRTMARGASASPERCLADPATGECGFSGLRCVL
jgi:hypothetical protein